MVSTARNVVTVNAGSSSIKLAVFGVDDDTSETTGLLTISISGIGQPVATLQTTTLSSSSVQKSEDVQAPDHATASLIIMDRLAQAVLPDSIVAIGHRVVHGGAKHAGPALVETISSQEWGLILQLDPQHAPGARQLIEQFIRQYPAVPQVACFDTAFFHDLPHAAKVLPLPQKYYERGVRRYGFHGLSYTSLLATFSEKAGEVAANGRVILAHLGSGTSLAATQCCKPIDTTMAFTPSSGVVMSTRSGDLDPGILGFLHRQDNMSIDAFDHMVNFESGLLGVSGATGDMQTLLKMEGEQPDAALAVELFVRDVKKTIGAFAALLGGVDSLVFSGGIGEQSAVLRSRICEGLEYMGIAIDENANEQHAFLISAQHSGVGVHVIATDEAQVIATQTRELLKHEGKL